MVLIYSVTQDEGQMEDHSKTNTRATLENVVSPVPWFYSQEAKG